MKPMFIRSLAAAVTLTLAATHALAAFPDQAIKITVGFPAGTGPDIVARSVGDQLGKEVKQSVVIENKAGAGGQIAAHSVAQSTPNGYSLLLGEVGSISITPETTANLGYAPQRDFAPITEAVRANFVLVTPPNSPYNTLEEFVKAAKTSKEEFNIATFGAGTPGHFGAELLAEAGKFKIVPIHYRSTGEAVTAIVSGQVQGAFVTTALAAPQLAGGKMKALAITGSERTKMLPNVPTFAESGMPDVNFGAWFAFFAPAGTPAAVLTQLNQDLVKSLKAPGVTKLLEDNGFVVVGSSREALADLLVTEQKLWSDVVKKTGFKIN